MTGNNGSEDYYASLHERLRREHEGRRREDREREERILNDSANRESSSGGGRGSRNPPTGPRHLKIDGIHWYVQDNAKNHHTDKFELIARETPIFRRGQTFFIALQTPVRALDEKLDDLMLIFSFGPRPSPIQATQHVLRVKRDAFKTDGSWGAKLYGIDKNAITIQVRTGPDACVGLWKCRVVSNLLGRNRTRPIVYDCPNDIYILFNPWEPSDSTYMSEKELLDEYVLNDKGKIWVGSYGTAFGRPWNFAQFDDSILPCIMILLEKSLRPNVRGNPVLVSRALSKMVNSNDDNGVLVGNWSGKYEDGKAPSAWTGSLAIIEDYFDKMSLSGRPSPVKYGQCWVFAGVLATMCRALGIPCRVVTNLESAHDANETLTIDKYYDESNKELPRDPFNPNGSKDSIWNFHVWNDAWMARPDLEINGAKGYGGWQAIDATPQETSGGVFQCGPASLEAVRRGQIGLAYDVPFILAEVNADIVHWKKDNEAKRGWKQLNADKFQIGRMILTKKPNYFDPRGDSDRMDVISEYKGKEGSRAERLALYNAITGNPNIANFYGRLGKETPGDVDFSLMDLDKVPVGSPFTVIVKIQNKSNEPRTVQADISVVSIFYTGVKAKEVKTASGNFVMKPNAIQELKLEVRPEQYMKKLVEYGIMKVFAICAVDETTQSWCAEDDFQVIKPCLELEVKPELKKEQPASIKMKFKNPLRKTLTKCFINYEGPGLIRTKTIPQSDVGASMEFEYQHEFIPVRPGSQRIVVTFTSDELTDIIGSAIVDIVE